MSRESIYKGVLAFKLENTKYIIKYVKTNDELREKLINAGKSGIEQAAFDWAEAHNNEFGNRFETELYDVFWEKVWYGIRTKGQ
jgi:hypothetical protein